MPRVYKPQKRFAEYDPNLLKAAIESVREGKLSTYKAAETYGIKRSTLQNRLNGKHTKKQGGQCALSEIDEIRLKNMLLTTSHWGFPLTKIDLRHVTKNYLDNSNKKIPIFKNNLPGNDWACSFLRRHRFSLRNGQNIAPARAQVTMEAMSKYFDNLERTIKDVPPENIANYDETNFTDNPGSKKLIFRRGVKYPENVMASSKTSTSVMFCGTATGVLLPIYVVYKAKNVYDTWMANGPPGARYNATSHGWFESATFIDWFRTVYIPYARTLVGPKVLIGDNLSSHISEEVIKLAEQENIIFICLPANCTHIAQPLDVTFFAPLKKLWRKILFDYKMKHPKDRVVPKEMFPDLMNQVWQGLFADNKGELNLKAGFRACGIYPLNKDPIMKKLDKKVVPGIEVDDVQVLSDSVLEYLKSLRQPETSTKRLRKKKVKTAPGNSICLEDFVVEEASSLPKKSKKSLPKKRSADSDSDIYSPSLPKKRKVVKKKENLTPNFDLPSVTNRRIVGKKKKELSPLPKMHSIDEVSSGVDLPSVSNRRIVEKKKELSPLLKKRCIDEVSSDVDLPSVTNRRIVEKKKELSTLPKMHSIDEVSSDVDLPSVTNRRIVEKKKELSPLLKKRCIDEVSSDVDLPSVTNRRIVEKKKELSTLPKMHSIDEVSSDVDLPSVTNRRIVEKKKELSPLLKKRCIDEVSSDVDLPSVTNRRIVEKKKELSTLPKMHSIDEVSSDVDLPSVTNRRIVEKKKELSTLPKMHSIDEVSSDVDLPSVTNRRIVEKKKELSPLLKKRCIDEVSSDVDLPSVTNRRIVETKKDVDIDVDPLSVANQSIVTKNKKLSRSIDLSGVHTKQVPLTEKPRVIGTRSSIKKKQL